MAGPGGMGRCFEPCITPDSTVRILLTHDELEALRLVDLLDLKQEEAAAQSGISRRTLWKDLHEARKKVADALVNGKIIEIEGCDQEQASECPRGLQCRRWGQSSTPDGEQESLQQ